MYEADTTGTVPNGGISHWYSDIGMPVPGAALADDIDIDVCIVGGGLTGLWTAYYLAKADPGLRIAIVEAEFVGFGASGRNGGWLSSALMGSAKGYGQGPRGAEGVAALESELRSTVDEVIRVVAGEGIDADVTKSGILTVARSRAQLERLRASTRDLSAGNQAHELSVAEVAERIRIAGAIGGVFDPDCARVHPAKLTRGLLGVVRSLGVSVYERTRVLDIGPGTATTARGTVRAAHVLRCTEGYTAGIRGLRRHWLPMNSAMIVTEPLPDDVWADIGWQGRELLGDFANAYFYAQRTADDRIALGGRGIPYRFASRTDVNGETQEWTIESLRHILAQVFPQARQATVTQAWCGVLAVPRDWCASVGVDPRTGLGWAGGYVGHGVAATNLAGRTLRDLVLREPSELTELPWVDHAVRTWEPEPLRWLGVKAMYGLYRAADRREAGGDVGISRLSRIGDRISGR